MVIYIATFNIIELPFYYMSNIIKDRRMLLTLN